MTNSFPYISLLIIQVHTGFTWAAADPEYFGGRVALVRPSDLLPSRPWPLGVSRCPRAFGPVCDLLGVLSGACAHGSGIDASLTSRVRSPRSVCASAWHHCFRRCVLSPEGTSQEDSVVRVSGRSGSGCCPRRACVLGASSCGARGAQTLGVVSWDARALSRGSAAEPRRRGDGRRPGGTR